MLLFESKQWKTPSFSLLLSSHFFRSFPILSLSLSLSLAHTLTTKQTTMWTIIVHCWNTSFHQDPQSFNHLSMIITALRPFRFQHPYVKEQKIYGMLGNLSSLVVVVVVGKHKFRFFLPSWVGLSCVRRNIWHSTTRTHDLVCRISSRTFHCQYDNWWIFMLFLW